MINFRFIIDNPWWGDRFDIIWYSSGRTPFKHKFWETQLMRDSTILGVAVKMSTRCDHAGVELELSLAGHSLNFNFYDNRHWNHDQGCYHNYTDDK